MNFHTPNLLDLNDDCLLEICNYLTISETFQIIGVLGSRLDAIAYQRIATFKHFDVSLREYPNYSTEQLKVIGRNLKKISLTSGYSINDEKVLGLLRPLCESGAGQLLRVLTLNYVQFNGNYSRCIGNVARQLFEIDLSFCQLTDELLQPLLEQCNNLQELSLIGNYTLCGKSLSSVNVRTIKRLTIELHDQWTFDVATFAALYPYISIRVYSQGRAELVQFGRDSLNKHKC